MRPSGMVRSSPASVALIANSKSGTRRVDQGANGLVAVGLAQLAGVQPGGLDGDERAGDELLVLAERTERCLLPGGVTVEGEDDLAAQRVVVHEEAAEHLDVLTAEGRAARGDRGLDAGEVAGHDVGVALDDDRAAGLGDLALGDVEAVEDLALLVDRGLGGVEVLGAVVVRRGACARRSPTTSPARSRIGQTRRPRNRS